MHNHTLENDMATKGREHVWYHNIAYDWLPLLYHIQTWVGNEKAQLMIYSYICTKLTTPRHCIMARDNTDKHLRMEFVIFSKMLSVERIPFLNFIYFFCLLICLYYIKKNYEAPTFITKVQFYTNFLDKCFHHVHQNSCSQA